VHPFLFYKHQHDNRVRSRLFVACQRWWFQWRFWFVPSVPGYTRTLSLENVHTTFEWNCQMAVVSRIWCGIAAGQLYPDNHFEYPCISRVVFWLPLYTSHCIETHNGDAALKVMDFGVPSDSQNKKQSLFTASVLLNGVCDISVWCKVSWPTFATICSCFTIFTPGILVLNNYNYPVYCRRWSSSSWRRKFSVFYCKQKFINV